ncbi:MAG: Chromate resistance protein ChrB [Planctomycetia bacterium]
MKRWLLLIYKIPREPSAGRVHVWRKLRQLGAIALQDAAWVLPHTPRTQEQFQWLSAEISELGGEVMLFNADQAYATDSQSLQQQFIESVNSEYQDILAELKEQDFDLRALSKRFQSAQQRDFFNSELGRQTREKLLAADGGRTS